MAEHGETELPTDARAQAIQVLAPEASSTINTTVSSSNAPIPAGAGICLLSATQAVWIAFGTSGGVSATVGSSPSFLVPAGGLSVRLPEGTTHWAAIRNDTDGRVCLTKLV
jgi:hypothetical protein